MSYPRLIVDVNKFRQNVRTVTGWCRKKGISVAYVTKCTLSDPVLTKAAREEGVALFADSRLLNLKRMPEGLHKLMLRIGCPEEADEIVRTADVSLQSEIDTIRALGKAAKEQGKKHKVVLTIDLGDLREGIYFENSEGILAAAEAVVRESALELYGVGTNLTCFGGIVPSPNNLGVLVDIADDLRRRFTLPLPFVSGGNSSSLPLLLSGKMPEGVTNLRIGESILLGTDTAYGGPLAGLRQDVFTLEAKLVEVQRKPSRPVGESSINAFGEKVDFEDKGDMIRGICAIGRQDVDIDGLRLLGQGVEILGGSSDHLLVDLTRCPDARVGDKLTFAPSYGALLRLYTSPFVDRVYFSERIVNN